VRKSYLVLGALVAALVVFAFAIFLGGWETFRSVPVVERRELANIDGRIGTEAASAPVSASTQNGRNQIPTSSPAEAEAPELRLSGYVRDQRGNAISRASVTVIGEDELPIEEVSANDAGFFELKTSILGTEIIAARDGFATGGIPDPRRTETRPSTAVIVLSEDAEIHGAIVGTPIERNSPTRIVLWDQSVGFPARSLANFIIHRKHPRYHCVEPQENGSFEIHGLSLDTNYWLAVGGNGFVGKGFPRLVRPDGKSLLIELERLYAIDTILVSKDNAAPLQVSSLLMPKVSVAVSPDIERAPRRLLTPDDPSGWLNSPMSDWDLFSTTTHFVRLIATTESTEKLGPFEMRFSVPGYSSVDASLYAFPAKGHEDVVQKLAMTQEGRSFGSVVVNFRGTHTSKDDLESHIVTESPLGRLLFEDTSGSAPFVIQLWNIPDKPLRVNNVPAGTYGVRIVSSMFSSDATSDRTVTIPSAEVTQLDLDIGKWGGVDVSVAVERKQKNQPWRGGVGFYVKKGNAARTYTFYRAPYKIRGLSPGDYELNCLTFRKGGIAPLESRLLQFHINESEIARVELDLMEKK
jgi:hypothetical protein